MGTLYTIETPDFGTLRVVPTGPTALELSGTITFAEPQAILAPFLRRVHELACELPGRALEVDVSRVIFVSSSAIRVFLDWAMWILQEPAERRYTITYLADLSVSWQRASLPVLSTLAPDVVRVESYAAVRHAGTE